MKITRLLEMWVLRILTPRLRMPGSWAAALVALGIPLVAADVADPVAGNSSTLLASTNAIGMNLATMDSLDDEHKLIAGDRISLRILEDQEDAKPLVVKYSGHVDALYIGLYPAEGKTCKQLARELKAELEKDYYHQATVILSIDQLSISKGRIYMVGAIANSGPFEIPGDEVFTIGKAVMRAGGFGDFADKRRVKITRKSGVEEGKPQVIVVNVADIIEKGRTEGDIELKAGDVIFVPERSFNF